MNSKKPLVLIIDRNSDRAYAMATSFSAEATALVSWKDRTDGRVRVSDDAALPPECLVRLWHLGDYEDSHPVWQSIGAKLTVFYGGNGGHDERCPPNGEIIWRPIANREEALTPSEAAQLLAFANDVTKKPSWLQEPQGIPTLASLAILCQGYLAVFAASGQFHGATVSRALSLMGWDSSKHAGLVRANSAEVQNPQWWLDLFGITSDVQESEEVLVGKWRELSNLLALEWGQGAETFLALPFVESLRQARPLNEPQIVAEAYVAIAERLKRGHV